MRILCFWCFFESACVCLLSKRAGKRCISNTFRLKGGRHKYKNRTTKTNKNKNVNNFMTKIEVLIESIVFLMFFQVHVSVFYPKEPGKRCICLHWLVLVLLLLIDWPAVTRPLGVSVNESINGTWSSSIWPVGEL